MKQNCSAPSPGRGGVEPDVPEGGRLRPRRFSTADSARGPASGRLADWGRFAEGSRAWSLRWKPPRALSGPAALDKSLRGLESRPSYLSGRGEEAGSCCRGTRCVPHLVRKPLLLSEGKGLKGLE